MLNLQGDITEEIPEGIFQEETEDNTRNDNDKNLYKEPEDHFNNYQENSREEARQARANIDDNNNNQAKSDYINSIYWKRVQRNKLSSDNSGNRNVESREKDKLWETPSVGRLNEESKEKRSDWNSENVAKWNAEIQVKRMLLKSMLKHRNAERELKSYTWSLRKGADSKRDEWNTGSAWANQNTRRIGLKRNRGLSAGVRRMMFSGMHDNTQDMIPYPRLG